MFQPKRCSPNYSPFTVQDILAHKTVKNPAKFLTICSIPNPKLKQPSLLLADVADDTISMDQESTCPTPSQKMSNENFENNQVELCSDQNIQGSSLFALNESLYHLPSQRISPISSMSDLGEGDEKAESSITKNIKISLKTIRSNNEICSPKANTNTVLAAAQSANFEPNQKNLPRNSPRSLRPYTGNPHAQYQKPITGRPDLEYYFSTKKNNASQYFKLNETNKIWIQENSSPATARESTDIWRNPEGPALHNIVFEPPKNSLQKAVGVRAKLKACVGADAPQPMILIKSLNEPSVSKVDKTPKATKTTVAWTLKCQTATLIPNSPATCSSKIKTAPTRILTSESKLRLGEKSNSRILQLV